MEAVIFDFNGTLLLDDAINMVAWKKYSKRKFNYDLSEEEYLKYNGTPGEIWIEGITKGKITGEEAIKCREEKEQQYRDELREADIDLIKGAKNFFEELKKNKIPYTIATSSNKLNVELYFEKFGLSQWFDFDKITFPDVIPITVAPAAYADLTPFLVSSNTMHFLISTPNFLAAIKYISGFGFPLKVPSVKAILSKSNH